MGESVKNDAKAGFFKRIGIFFKDLQVEFKKIVWPDKKTLGKQAVAVTAISVVLGCIIALLDMVIQYGVNFLTM